MTTNRPRTESSTDSSYKTTVHTLTVSRKANDVGGGTVGAIERIDLEATRSKRRDAGTYHRTISYVVDDGIAQVAEVTPRYPDGRNADHAFKPGHVAAMLAETDAVVRDSVPEIEGVRALSDTLGSERAKCERERAKAATEEQEATA